MLWVGALIEISFDAFVTVFKRLDLILVEVKNSSFCPF